MEREYRLDLNAFRAALDGLVRDDEDLPGVVSFAFEDGRLMVTRMFSEASHRVDVTQYVNATGRWPLAVDVPWSDVWAYIRMGGWVMQSFFIRFAEQRLHIRHQPIAFGRVVRGQIAMDFTASATPEADSSALTDAPVIAPPTALDALLARIAEIDAQNAGQPPAKVSEISRPVRARRGACKAAEGCSRRQMPSAATCSACATARAIPQRITSRNWPMARRRGCPALPTLTSTTRLLPHASSISCMTA
jgi:hypothetical protein